MTQPEAGLKPSGPASEWRLVALSRVLAWISGAGMLLASCWIAADVLLRLTVNRSLPGSVELSGYVLAIGSSWAFAYALFNKSHVRVDTVYALLPRRMRPWLDLAALCSLAFVVGMLCYRAFELTGLSVRFGSKSQMQWPLWIPQGLWAFGLAFFLIAIVSLIGAVTQALLRGNAARVMELASVNPVQAEVQAELKSAAGRKAQ